MLHLYMLLLHLLIKYITDDYNFGINKFKMSKKVKYHFEGHLEKPPSQKINLTINHLENGTYELNIIYKNKILKTTTFKK